MAILVSLGCAPEASPTDLEIIATDPESEADHPADQAIRVFFDRYLEPTSEWSRIATLNSGEVRFGISTTYDPVDRAIVVRPRAPLRAGIGYVLRLDHERLTAMDGALLPQEFELPFLSVPASSQWNEEPEVVSFESHLKPVIEEKCGCHGPAPGAFPPLQPDALIRQVSQRQPARILVEPGQPLQSYLIQRMLPEYPGVRGEPKDLTPDEVRLFITWINRLGISQ